MLQLPPEMWYIIFRMRTRMIVAEHYACWLLKHKDFNKQIIKALTYVKYDDDNYKTVPYNSHSYKIHSWKRFNSDYPYICSGLELICDKYGCLCWCDDIKHKYATNVHINK